MATRSLLALLVGVTAAGCALDAAPPDPHDHADPGALFERAHLDQLDGKADTSCSGVRVPDRGGFDRRVALTFDDGPSPETTPAVLEVLRRHGAPATFFVNGNRVGGPASEALAKEIVDDPLFLLGNHSWSHPDLATLGPETVASQIDRVTDVLVAAGAAPRYFRFPFGSATCGSAQAVRERGYLVTGWHVDSADWCFAAGGGRCPASTFRYVPDAYRDDMESYVVHQLGASGGGIVLFHDIHAHTADSLDAILSRLEAEGYRFVRLDDVDAFPLLHGQTPPPSPFIGDPCDGDEACGFDGGRCHEAGFCTRSCAGYCPDRATHAPTLCVADPEREAEGICVPRSGPRNARCASVPGTAPSVTDRFVGGSGAASATAEACVPTG